MLGIHTQTEAFHFEPDYTNGVYRFIASTVKLLQASVNIANAWGISLDRIRYIAKKMHAIITTTGVTMI